ncbi:MAG: chromosomal replication initiator protein DnaA [Muribaculaceae bacterium]|nr:chromosomal replication initiator protein DnaA [Muribaculaceae bacterium]MDE6642680.1 chromosomal replication initiator protein DnaA [Muribaculaceae bacterium]
MTNDINKQKWDECLSIIKDVIPEEQFKCWFEPIFPVSFVDDRLTISVPSSYFAEHIDERYIRILGPVLHRVYGPNVKLEYSYKVVNDALESVNVRSENPSPAIKPGLPAANPFNVESVPEIDSQLNPKYTFENYCGSMCNKVARAIGMTIGDDPRVKTFNPLFIIGPSGSGKTHLMHAIGIRIKERQPLHRVLYVTARLFESQFTAASLKGRINDFIYFYQSIDTLIIDDIQDLIGKDKTQNAFFHIFNHLHLNNKQIIMSSDCPPSQMNGLSERMMTRFKWGMTVKLERPDFELRREVLIQKAQTEGLNLSNEIIDYIAENVTNSIREIEGVMLSIVTHAAILNVDITIDLARNVINNAIRMNASTTPQINFEMVTQSVSSYYNIDPDAIYTKNRKREISDARQMVMFLAKKHAKMQSVTIGTRLSRSHSTVLYAIKQIEERLPFEKQLQEDVAAIEKIINSPQK